jgi:hypothetical protein
LKPEWWRSPLIQGKYQGEKAYDKGKRIIIIMENINVITQNSSIIHKREIS